MDWVGNVGLGALTVVCVVALIAAVCGLAGAAIDAVKDRLYDKVVNHDWCNRFQKPNRINHDTQHIRR